MKLHLVLFVTAVLAASAVHARFSLNEEMLRILMQESKEGGGVTATPTNGTLKSILKEISSG